MTCSIKAGELDADVDAGAGADAGADVHTGADGDAGADAGVPVVPAGTSINKTSFFTSDIYPVRKKQI